MTREDLDRIMVRTRHPKLGKPPNVAILAALRRHRAHCKPPIGDHSYSQIPLPTVRRLRKRPRRILTVSVVDFALSYNIRYFKVHLLPDKIGKE